MAPVPDVHETRRLARHRPRALRRRAARFGPRNRHRAARDREIQAIGAVVFAVARRWTDDLQRVQRTPTSRFAASRSTQATPRTGRHPLDRPRSGHHVFVDSFHGLLRGHAVAYVAHADSVTEGATTPRRGPETSNSAPDGPASGRRVEPNTSRSYRSHTRGGPPRPRQARTAAPAARQADSTSALIRFRVVCIPLRLVLPRAQPSSAQ